MSEIALYRKYRPQGFAEVIGQEQVVASLESALKQKRLAHAYLFAGGRGTGKTTVARILARAAGASDNDIVEIDAASNNGVDDIRELREAVRTLPFESPVKVYIIDEVHMLSKAAFNALLKTLEEPPKHVLFILATTEIHKVLETIVSRCQTFVFKKPSLDILKKVIVSIAGKEGYALSPEAAELIAFLGDGAFRDAIGILQKVIIGSADKKIDALEVENITGAPSLKLVNDLIVAVMREDLAAGIALVEKVAESGLDLRVYTEMLLRTMRQSLLVKYAPVMKKDILVEVGEDQGRFLEDLAQTPKPNILINFLKQLLVAYSSFGTTYLPQLSLELALINLFNDRAGE